MSDTVANREDRGVSTIPIDISKLVDVYKNEKPDKDYGETSRDELLEQEAVLNHIEGLGHVHETGVNFTSISHEVADGFNGCPGTHAG